VTAVARLMLPAEARLIIDYFHHATPEFLHRLGVDPARLPARDAWQAHYDHEFALPLDQRNSVLVLWTLNGAPIGFSTADKIEIEKQAFMHLHIFTPDRRGQGLGTARRRRSISRRCG
jgi:hypothetical protein